MMVCMSMIGILHNVVLTLVFCAIPDSLKLLEGNPIDFSNSSKVHANFVSISSSILVSQYDLLLLESSECYI